MRAELASSSRRIACTSEEDAFSFETSEDSADAPVLAFKAPKSLQEFHDGGVVRVRTKVVVVGQLRSLNVV